MVLNTSFNENEPVVCRPAEALDCFLRTKMDVIAAHIEAPTALLLEGLTLAAAALWLVSRRGRLVAEVGTGWTRAVGGLGHRRVAQITKAVEQPWRFLAAGSRYVSKPVSGRRR